jgi:hypothetical protein
MQKDVPPSEFWILKASLFQIQRLLCGDCNRDKVFHKNDYYLQFLNNTTNFVLVTGNVWCRLQEPACLTNFSTELF